MEIVEEGKVKSSQFNKVFFKFFSFGLIVLVIVLGVYTRVQTKYSSKVADLDTFEHNYDVALVFGAGLVAKGVPGLILEDRVLTAIKLFQRGKVSEILMSGDNESPGHNEVQAMKNFAIKEGLDEEIILLDHSGLDTFQSCNRAKNVYNLDKVVLITQKFHLKRALYICNELGLDAIGVEADLHNYQNIKQYSFREVLASVNAWGEVVVSKILK